MKDLKIDKKKGNSTRNLLSKEDLVNTKKKIIQLFVVLFFILALMILGLYFIV